MAPGAEAEFLQRVLIQRVGYSQSEGTWGRRQRKDGPGAGQIAFYQPQGDRLGNERSFVERELLLRGQGSCDRFVVDKAPVDENLAEAPSGAMLLVQSHAEMPFLEPSRFHQ